jgi:small-conductance mechanosensitive channel
MQGIIYEEPSIWLFLLITVLMGGWAAWMTGRAIAITWRHYWNLIVYLFILGAAVRFIHFALFQGTLRSLHYYAVDTIVLLIIGSLGYQYYRTRLMTSQYRWMYERTGPFSWREKAPTTNG